MYDPSGLTNTTGNAGRGYQGQSTPFDFSSLGNIFGAGGGSGAGTGSAPMNMMPQNPGHQPGMNLPGMLQLLSGAFGQGSPFNWQGGFGDSWRNSPLGKAVGGGASRRDYTPEFGADIPRYLANQARDRRGGPR